MRVRQASAAGVFYPAEADALAAAVDGYLLENPCEGPVPKVLVVPHAGIHYSGPVAARAYNLLAGGARPRRVVLVGPAHEASLGGMALPDVSHFVTPLGAVPLDSLLTYSLETFPGVSISAAAHAQEHCLEVQLPFLQRLLGEAFSILPVLVGRSDPDEVAAALATVWGDEDTLVVISTDLSHYQVYAEARALDRQTSQRICALKTGIAADQACGHAILNGLLQLASRQGLKAELLDLRSSADSGGDPRRVVGYGAYVLY